MITQEELKNRQNFIGGSDAPVVLGLNPLAWGTPDEQLSDLWLEKTGQIAPGSTKASAAMEAGSYLEPAILAWAETKLGRLARVPMITHENGFMCVNLDAMVDGEDITVEAKSTVKGEEWGEEGTDEVPQRVIVQVHHGFAHLPKVALCYVPVIIADRFGGWGFRMYQVERNHELVDYIVEANRKFMGLVRRRQYPTNFVPTLEKLKLVERNSSVTSVLDETYAEFQAAKNAHTMAEKRYDEAKRAILAELGQSDTGECSLGKVTYRESDYRGFTVKPSKRRTLRLKPYSTGDCA